MTIKGLVNKKWTSTSKYREVYDTIFGKKQKYDNEEETPKVLAEKADKQEEGDNAKGEWKAEGVPVVETEMGNPAEAKGDKPE